MHNYPTYRFNRAGASIRIENEVDDRALKGEWFDHPPTEDSAPIAFDDDTDIDAMLNEEDASDDTKKKKSTKKK